MLPLLAKASATTTTMSTITIPTAFDSTVLPKWAQQYPQVVDRCRHDLAYRCRVCEVSSRAAIDALKHEAGVKIFRPLRPKK